MGCLEDRRQESHGVTTRPLPPAAAEATFYEAAIAARPKLGQDGVLSPEKK